MKGANLQSFAAKNLVQNTNRAFLEVHATTAMTIALAGGTAFAVAANTSWTPDVAPTSSVTITGTGVMVSDTLT